jgi:hypothetical protein
MLVVEVAMLPSSLSFGVSMGSTSSELSKATLSQSSCLSVGPEKRGWAVSALAELVALVPAEGAASLSLFLLDLRVFSFLFSLLSLFLSLRLSALRLSFGELGTSSFGRNFEAGHQCAR